ncbi:hypothetical protein CPB83DRAFT_132739 [Crepidotus variabilis]|uniref:Glucose receptor Git3 N-terminal domain-containing protein n=1 Tax=Crepidotus variabilis TaxID=179855 RepID=A0A9P6ELG5_9AGAR|nr:hypothetical protein CPB83DRAFT_132739 [Crepidotus variabilis]
MTLRDFFNFSERAGLLFTIEASLLSFVAVTFILCFALLKWLRGTLTSWGRRRPADASDSSLFLNLMFADLIQAAGCLFNFRWMAEAAVTGGPFCNAQAALKQVGIVGVSLTSLCIAVHTFTVLVLRRMPPKQASKIAVIWIWIFAAIIITIPHAIHKNETYYGPTVFWCWILPKWKTEQIVTEYLWVWLAALSMLILYTIMYCVMKGWINIGKSLGAPLVVLDTVESGGPSVDDLEEEKRVKAIAKLLLYFPAVYLVAIVPNSISRWLTFDGEPPPPELALFTNTIFALSGLFHFILFLLTRPVMVVGKPVVFVHSLESARNSSSTPKRTYSNSSLGHLPERYDFTGTQGDFPNISQTALRSPISVTLSSAGHSTANRSHSGRPRTARLAPSSSDLD